MGFLNRPNRRLVSRVPRPPLPPEDSRWLAAQGFNYQDMPRHTTWYYPNGGSGMGPTDPYHLHLYRMKGYTLKAPYIPPVKPPLHPLVRKAMKILGERSVWVGTPTEFIAEAGSFGQSPDKLGRAIFKANVTESLDREGITISRSYRGKARVLKLEKA
jgi:hypothetical protein